MLMLMLSGGFTAEEFQRTLSGSVFQLKHASFFTAQKDGQCDTSDLINGFTIAALIEKLWLSPWTLKDFHVCLNVAW